MRRITLWVLSTVCALVLLFSYRTSTMGPGGGTAALAPAVPGAGDGTAARAGSGPRGAGPAGPGDIASDGTGPAGDTGGGTGSRAAGGGTFDGSVAQTRWGPLQVRITVSAGRITEVAALRVPDDNFRDQMINSRAVPILRQEALRAQSAEIDTVSGATVTSEGYRESLQAALDAAHLR